MLSKLKISEKKKRVLHTIFNLLLVLLGTFILAFGTGIFLVPFNINTGGVAGLSIVLSKTGIPVDIWSYIICWSLFIISFFILGYKFTLSTLLSTIFYPIFLSIILRTSFSFNIVNLLSGASNELEFAVLNNGVIYLDPAFLETLNAGRLLLISLFGGLLVGLGCGITFIGNGSTGGLDIIVFILKKYLNVNVSITTFAIDGSIILIGMIIDLVSTGGDFFITSLVGIVGAISCALAIEIVYNGLETSFICDIITSKSEEINAYVQKELERTVTIFKVVGGYSKEEKTMIRLVFSKREYTKIKDAIAKIDPDAFITFSKAKLVTGEGFSKNESSNKNLISDIKKLKNRKKDGK